MNHKEETHHDHEHDHHHHEHSHDEHCDCEQCSGPISIHTHDSSIIGSFRFEINQPYDKAQQFAESTLKSIAASVEGDGGIIGHIKAVVQAEGESCMISLTDEDVNVKQMNVEQSTIEGAAIVFNIDPDKLKSIIEDAFSSLVSQ